MFSLISLALFLPIQQGPNCLYPNNDGTEVQYLWGSEIRQMFQRSLSGGQQVYSREVWAVGDGGRIGRRREPLQANDPGWVFMDTPDDARHSLLDVSFLDAPADHIGFAGGSGGRILKTVDSGATWQHMNPAAPVFQNELNPVEPATLWRVRMVDENVGFACGLWTLKYTMDGGASWNAVEIFDDATLQNSSAKQADHIEFYSMEILVDGNGGWEAVAAGERWKTAGGNIPGDPSNGMVMRASSTTATDPQKNWWATQLLGINDPWDMEFEDDNTNGYLAGGTGTATGAMYSTSDGGDTWQLELGPLDNPTTQYGVAALGNGFAMSCGYRGEIWRRDPSGTWTLDTTSNMATVPLTAPLGDVHGYGNDNAWLVGGWGIVRKTTDGGVFWDQLNPGSAATQNELLRYQDACFYEEGGVFKGVAVGQAQAVGFSDDGGCTWNVVDGGPLNSSEAPLEALAIAPLDTASGERRGLAVGYDSINQNATPIAENVVRFTTDGGRTWAPCVLASGFLAIDAKDVAHAGDTGVNAKFWIVGRKLKSSNPNVWNPTVMFAPRGGDPLQHPSLPPLACFDVTDIGVLGADTELSAVTFESVTSGFCVGYDETAVGSESKAFSIQFTGSAVITSELSFDVSVDRSKKLLDINHSPFTGEVYAVGESGTVLQLVGSTFVPVVDPALQVALDVTTIECSPTGPTILAGLAGPPVEATAGDLGKLLKYDGTSWSVIKAQTNKSVDSIFLFDDDTGWIQGGGEGELVSSEFGTVADSLFLFYDASN